jgi:hypothetical protein
MACCMVALRIYSVHSHTPVQYDKVRKLQEAARSQHKKSVRAVHYGHDKVTKLHDGSVVGKYINVKVRAMGI